MQKVKCLEKTSSRVFFNFSWLDTIEVLKKVVHFLYINDITIRLICTIFIFFFLNLFFFSYYTCNKWYI